MRTLPNQKTEDLGLFVKTLNQSQIENNLRWIADLRSGKFTQGKARLKNNDGSYCCLGVLQLETLGIREDLEYDNVLNEKACNESGVRERGGSLYGEGSLWFLNDHFEWSFEEIAQLIEDQLSLKAARSA